MTATCVAPAAYVRGMVGGTESRWPDAGRVLLDELVDAPDRLALLIGDVLTTDGVAQAFSAEFGHTVVRLGAAAVHLDQPPTSLELVALAGQGTIVSDIELLFSPQLATNPVTFIRTLSRRRPTIAVWPGTVDVGRARYGLPGRPDHFDAVLRDAIVLYARPTRFPDEVPFDIERIAP